MKEIFAECLPYDKDLKGRMGGNIPKLIENDLPDGYGFYATLVHPEKENTMLSICIDRDFERLLANDIYPNINIKVIEHEYSYMSDVDSSSLKDFGLCSISSYTDHITNKNEFLFIRVYGEPRMIQPKSRYYEQLEKDNYSFFLMIDEEGYDTDLIDTIFMYGALYLYKHNVTGEVIAGYWQCS
ncbi:hypothetical protein [Myroides sp. N17-2]|uniref:hypothetical protein n=1 Tax=Myroides sp. N17-2 TaxID=2030799 RepID=UPI000EFA6463|nr:hypothetical protein [Myroides sp. N17-2]